MNSTVSILVELPESLVDIFRNHLELTGKDQDQVATTAIALYLLQNPSNQTASHQASRIYLDSMFKRGGNDV